MKIMVIFSVCFVFLVADATLVKGRYNIIIFYVSEHLFIQRFHTKAI